MSDIGKKCAKCKQADDWVCQTSCAAFDFLGDAKLCLTCGAYFATCLATGDPVNGFTRCQDIRGSVDK